MLDPTKIIRAALLTARRLPDPRVNSRINPIPNEGYAKGGEAFKARNFKKKALPPKVAAQEPTPAVDAEEFGWHPAHKIPGIHIVTSETGEPVFTGER